MSGMQFTPSDGVLAKLKEGLGEFVDRLRTSLGDDLISVVLLGGGAGGRLHPEVADAILMLVLRMVNIAILYRMSVAAEPFRRMFQLSLLTVTEDGSAGSGGGFPTEFVRI